MKSIRKIKEALQSEMKFVLSPVEADLKNSKIRTLKILAQLKLPHIEAKIITPAAFLRYKQEGVISPSLRKILEVTCQFFLEKSDYISIRTATEKGVSFLLPRSGSLGSVSSGVEFFKKTWDFFIKKAKNPRCLGVSFVVHNFIPSFAAGTIDSQLFNKKNWARIEATYGIWEGIQSNLHDTYIVDKKSNKIVEKIIPQKNMALFSNAEKWQYQPVPKSWRTKAVLSLSQIKELLRQTQMIERYFGPARIEFILRKIKKQKSPRAVLLWHITKMPGPKGIFTYRVIPVKEKTIGQVVYSGSPFIVESSSDLSKAKFSSSRQIIYLSDKIIRKRDLFLVQQIAHLAQKYHWPVVYKGGQLTHISILLREQGVKVFPINRNIKLAKTIKIVQYRII